MQVAETFTFPIPADQLPAEVRSQLAKLLPADAAERRAALCPTGTCPFITAAAAAGSEVDLAVDISSGGGDDVKAGDKKAARKEKGKSKGGKKGGSGQEEEEADSVLQVGVMFG
jgi:hypothetical protein